MKQIQQQGKGQLTRQKNISAGCPIHIQIKNKFKINHSWVTEGRGICLPNGQWHQSQHHGDCQTQGVIYLMAYKCHAFYIGKTIRELDQRIRDHIYYSRNGKVITAVTRHIGLHHKFDNSTFFVLEVFPPNPRGGDWDNQILRSETLWIEYQ